MHKNQKGIAHIWIFVLIIIVAVVGFAGWQVWKNRNSSSKSTQSSSETIQTTTSGVRDKTPADATSNISPEDEKFAKEHVEGYSELPEDFRPVIISFLNKVEKACVANELHIDPPLHAGGQVKQVVRDSFISMNLQQEDCGGGALLYFAETEDGWAQPFRTTGLANSCKEVNKYKFTNQIIKQCYSDDGTLIDNTNP